jgi:hypothetical protein
MFLFQWVILVLPPSVGETKRFTITHTTCGSMVAESYNRIKFEESRCTDHMSHVMDVNMREMLPTLRRQNCVFKTFPGPSSPTQHNHSYLSNVELNINIRWIRTLLVE